MSRTPVDLFVFGSRNKGPRPPRVGIDIFPDEQGMVGPEPPNSPTGASAYGDTAQSGLTGHYYLLPAGTELPLGLDAIADGMDVRPDSLQKPTHYTIFPTQRMTAEQFLAAFERLPWQYAGKQK